MKQATLTRIKKDCIKFWSKGGTDEFPVTEMTFDQFYRFVIRQSKKSRKEALTEAIELFHTYREEPMTGNVVNLELKAIRGDYEIKR